MRAGRFFLHLVMHKKKFVAYSILMIAYYLILFSALDLFKNPSVSGGPCGPGPAFFFMLISPFVILPFVATSIILSLKGRRHHLGPLIIHFLAITFVLALVK
jgi:hypothetical protein